MHIHLMLLETNKEIVVVYLTGTLFIFLLVSAIFIYLLLHQRKVNEYKAKIKIDEYNKKIEIIQSIQQGEEKERIRVSEELHDVVGTKLSAIKMNLEHLKNNKSIDVGFIDTIISLADETVCDVRNISNDLQINFKTLNELVYSINSLINNITITGGCLFELYYEPSSISINQDILTNVYKIVLETINNIVKHAQAKNATIQIHGIIDTLQIIVSDDGIGFSYNEKTITGNGIHNIKNRVHFCKGDVIFDSSNNGTTVIINIPIC